MKETRIPITFLLLLIIFTTSDIVLFFYIKNTTHYLQKEITFLKNDISKEKYNLSIKQSSFNKKYNVHYINELSKSVNLHFTDIKQIIDTNDAFSKK